MMVIMIGMERSFMAVYAYPGISLIDISHISYQIIVPRTKCEELDGAFISSKLILYPFSKVWVIHPLVLDFQLGTESPLVFSSRCEWCITLY